MQRRRDRKDAPTYREPTKGIYRQRRYTVKRRKRGLKSTAIQTARLTKRSTSATITGTDKRYHVDHPFEHGKFEHFGASYRYHIERFDRDHHRFWLPGGFYFQVADWDWPICADWCWECGDDFVVYEDPDHIGWYMLYNVHTGVYVHASYLGT
jgi:hypothetical protein